MDASSVKAVAQRQLKLEKQREILQRKRQQKYAHELQALQAKSFNNSVDLGPISSRSTVKTPSRDSQTSISENFAYDGPQALELGNPDLLDPPVQVLRVSGDKGDAATPAFVTPKSSSKEHSDTTKTHQAIHIPPIRPVKLPLPKTPLTGTDRRSLFESMELEEVEEDVSTAAVKLRPKAERRKVRSAARRQAKAPPRPHSAMEASQRPQVKTNNLIGFDKTDVLVMETSVASATVVRSVTPSTASAVSYQWHEKTKSKNPHSRGKGSDLGGRKAVKPKGTNAAKRGTLSESGVIRRTKKKVTRQQISEGMLGQEVSRSTDHLHTKRKRAHKREALRSTDGTEHKRVDAVSQDTQEKGQSNKPHSLGRATHVRDDAVQSNLVEDSKDPRVERADKISSTEHPASPIRSARSKVHRKEAASPNKRTESNGREKLVSRKDDLVHDESIKSTITRIFSAGDDVEEFITTPAPKGVTVCCRISRDKHGLEGGLFPSYFLHLERQEDGRRFFLLAARRKRRATTCNYLISLDATTPTTTSSPLDAPGDGRLTVGHLRSNFLGTQFVLLSTRSRCTGPHAPAGHSNADLASGDWSKEIATISYEPNILGFKGPRRMTVFLPSVVEPTDPKANYLSKYAIGDPETRSSLADVIELHNKKPMWNEETQSYVLNFHGRVTQASVKNFQLIDNNDESTILMQFGRVSNDIFTMDYTHPLTALQAFGIAISSLAGKLACE